MNNDEEHIIVDAGGLFLSAILLLSMLELIFTKGEAKD